MAGIGGEEFGQRRRDILGGNCFVVDVEPLEGGLVETAACFVTGVEVELVGVRDQLEGEVNELCAAAQIVLYLVELAGEAFTLFDDVAESLLDLGGGECACGGEIEQISSLTSSCLS
ncbi:hypothetical protein HH308_24130 [Gordonia sp. TBRC 11910]|uniref:Uncharacterized protein n=1 Tax=Gordonia asplenii TaxID=2725283 RepID=A0A848L1H6_9ACTN|nr:hypothetical protein [Gordonia asplenii]NMO04312.1 hypothetical protein [Gordonia asplenii]